MQRALAQWGWILPLVAFLLLLGVTFYLDRQNRSQMMGARESASSVAAEEAAILSEAISASVARRIGALAVAKLQFTQVEDSLSQQTFLAAVDSVISGFTGLAAVSVIQPGGGMATSSGALLGRTWRDPLGIPAIAAAYGKARATGQPAATEVLDLMGGARFIVFDPVVGTGTESVRAVLAAELDPLAVARAALEDERDNLGQAFYALYDPRGTRVTTVPSPQGWERVTRPVRVADREWTLAVAYPPVSMRSFEMVSGVIRVSGILLALGFALSLFLLWRTVSAQQAEIARRVAAERSAEVNAAEARSLSEQLESGQKTALRLSGSLEPTDVIDEFLGSVGEALQADLALLYGFDEHGDQVVGRHRIVLNPEGVPPHAVPQEDFREVRVPVALVPHLAEPIATGEPYLARGDDSEGVALTGPGVARPSALLAVPLTVGTHLVGVAVWESYGTSNIGVESIPFARTVAAHAAASLHASELLDGVRRARQRATREATRLATVLDRLADGVILFDARGKPERVNPAAEALLGERVEEVPLAEWPEFLGIRQPAYGPGAEPFPLLAPLDGLRVDKYRFTARQSGGERYMAASAAPIRGQDGDVRGVAVVIRDVTDEHEYAEILRHTNEELREQANLLERANDELTAATLAKDQFLAMMSHELRTPINAVIGYSDLLDIGVHGTLNPKQREMVTRVVETSRHLLGLINDVLDLTKVSAGRIDLNILPVAMKPVVLRAANQVAPLADSKGIEVRVEAEEDVLLLADETRLAQVLINLAANAVKFTEQGSVVLHSEVDEATVSIHVTDTGSGIPPSELERVFEEFHQVDAGHARKAGGTGLGLAISRRLARLMGGDLQVESKVGEGTTFTLELPLAEHPDRSDTDRAVRAEARP
ncbi:MAG TPA: PAS domain-containing sensor histidine kinase [Longimicrobiales bacterium]|nr:PAS domain-containing sensor histidine kinase [Longimicrobiales bacterium]